MLRRALEFGLLLLALGSCSSSSTNVAGDACEPGDLKQCACPGGGKGIAACESGAFGACACDDAGVGGSAGTTGTGGLGGSSGTGSDAGAGGPPSCQGLAPCLPGHSCCESPLLTEGTFQRDASTDLKSQAHVGAFRLDAFEVTVARFRKFVNAVVGQGWKPSVGSGKHQPSALVGEPGWQQELSASLHSSLSEWEASMASCQPFGASSATWSSEPGKNDALPMNCVDFAQAYAFCIWDGGFLPTEAELSYAWVGAGSAPRKYPWGAEPADSAHAVVGLAPPALPPPVGSKPLGASPNGHYDLFGSVFELALDHFMAAGSYPMSPCDDCVLLTANPLANRAIRGGGWVNFANEISAGTRLAATSAANNTGFRCARPPS